jgi:hypothetical protein
MQEPVQSHSTHPDSQISSNEESSVQHPESETPDLKNEALQAEYRKAYLEQLRRMSCPGCGEDPTIPF